MTSGSPSFSFQTPASPLWPGKPPRRFLLFSRCPVQAASDTCKEMSQPSLRAPLQDTNAQPGEEEARGRQALFLTTVPRVPAEGVPQPSCFPRAGHIVGGQLGLVEGMDGWVDG